MNKENKKQLLLIGIALCMVLLTLLQQYSDFMFHTYTKPDTSTVFIYGENEDVRIEGYEYYYDGTQYYGDGRLYVLTDNFIMKNDTVEISYEVNNETYTHSIKVKQYDGYINIPFEESDNLIEDIKDIDFNISITRKKKVIYEEVIDMNISEYLVYNGTNKDYMIDNIYMNEYCLKTGIFKTNIEDLAEQYPYMEIDYMICDEQLEMNDYIRFIHMSGNTEDFLNGQYSTKEYYNESLFEQDIICVISLMKDEQDENPFVFQLDLTLSVKEVSYE